MKSSCRIISSPEDIDLAKLVSDPTLGIVTLDIGRMDAKDSKWLPLDRYTSELGIGLHRAISTAFVDKYGKEPIGYLFEHYESNGITSNIMVHSFAVSDSILESVSDNGRFFIIKKDQDVDY